MSNSPINFLGMLGAASSLMGGRSAKKNAGKIRKRVSKLENQVGAMISKQNQGPTQVEQPIEIQPEPQLGVVPQAFDLDIIIEDTGLLPVFCEQPECIDITEILKLNQHTREGLLC